MNAPLEIRPARADDLRELHALIESAYRGESAKAGWTHEADLLEAPRTSTAALKSLLDDPSELLLLAHDGAAIVGSAQVTHLPDDIAYLGLLTVNPRMQAGGLGKQILAAAEREARERFGVDNIELAVISRRTELIAYYGRRGYLPTGEERSFPVSIDPPLFLAVLRKKLAEG